MLHLIYLSNTASIHSPQYTHLSLFTQTHSLLPASARSLVWLVISQALPPNQSTASQGLSPALFHPSATVLPALSQMWTGRTNMMLYGAVFALGHRSQEKAGPNDAVFSHFGGTEQLKHNVKLKLKQKSQRKKLLQKNLVKLKSVTNFQNYPLHSTEDNGDASPSPLLHEGWAGLDPHRPSWYRLTGTLLTDSPWWELLILQEVCYQGFHSTARVKQCPSEKPQAMMLVLPWHSVTHACRPLLKGQLKPRVPVNHLSSHCRREDPALLL